MNRTKIEWVRNTDGSQGHTINPVKGLCPMACSYCYARAMYKRFKWNPEIRFDRNALDEIKTVRRPSRIFVGSTMELFGDWIRRDWLNEIFDVTEYYTQHTFIFLTKQPQNLIKWKFPKNCWVGATFTCSGQDNKFGYPFMDIKASVKFISFEPLLGRDLLADHWAEAFIKAGIDWVIIGQQTPISDKTQPKKEWIQEIVHAASKAHIPVFLKENLRALLPCREPFWTSVFWYEYDKGVKVQMAENRLRQEFPKNKNYGIITFVEYKKP